jgi:hypothetical protein
MTTKSSKVAINFDNSIVQILEEIAKQENLSGVEVEIRRLSDKIRDIRSEQNYQRVS